MYDLRCKLCNRPGDTEVLQGKPCAVCQMGPEEHARRIREALGLPETKEEIRPWPKPCS